MRKYLVVFAKADGDYSAYVPDLPGCLSTGETIEDTERNIKEAISLYLDALREEGKPIPEPTTQARVVSVALGEAHHGASRQPGDALDAKAKPTKGTASALMEFAGAWSYMTPEEIEEIKADIFGSRRSSK